MEKIKFPRCGNEKAWEIGKPKGKQQHQCKKCIREQWKSSRKNKEESLK